MDADFIHKISILSDTHGRFEMPVYSCLIGNYHHNQIYKSEIITDNEDLIERFNNERPQLEHFKPAYIVHAGDIGAQYIIDKLESIAFLKAVSGNCDYDVYRTMDGHVKDFEHFEFYDVGIAVAHIPQDLDSALEGSFLRPARLNKYAKAPKLKIFGHTHVSHIEVYDKDDVYICPGSASMGRGGTPNSIANVYVYKGTIIAADLIAV